MCQKWQDPGTWILLIAITCSLLLSLSFSSNSLWRVGFIVTQSLITWQQCIFLKLQACRHCICHNCFGCVVKPNPNWLKQKRVLFSLCNQRGRNGWVVPEPRAPTMSTKTHFIRSSVFCLLLSALYSGSSWWPPAALGSPHILDALSPRNKKYFLSFNSPIFQWLWLGHITTLNNLCGGGNVIGHMLTRELKEKSLPPRIEKPKFLLPIQCTVTKSRIKYMLGYKHIHYDVLTCSPWP